jgi:alginate O-acetyltransferase complex protein AlgI
MWGIWHATGVSAFVYWQRFKRRRRLRGLDRPGLRWIGMPLTIAFASVGGVYTAVLDTAGSYQTVRVLVRMIGL